MSDTPQPTPPEQKQPPQAQQAPQVQPGRRLASPTPTVVSARGPVNSYDEFPYESHPFAQTHPSRLFTVATLFGLSPTPIDRCRVLELGCASGGNIVPMADAYPESWFVGVDYSGRQIQDGERVVRASGLKNVSLRHASITDVDEGYGKFDYVICHGVYSWVPTAVREKILDVCAKNLNPNGVAYVSYNTYPGWHMRGMIRDMMRYHAMRFDNAVKRVEQARALLDFLAQSAKNDTGPYGTLLRSELEGLRHQNDSYLYHEHLEDVNDPLYFYQFVEMAHKHGLRYLGEARLPTMVTANFSPDVRKAIETVATDQIQIEQYLDFVRNRTFRETLLVLPGSMPNWAIKPEAVRKLHVSLARKVPDESVNLRTTDPAPYNLPSGVTITTTSPVLKAAVRALNQRWPATVSFADLDAAVVELLDMKPDGGNALAVTLLNTYLATQLIELHAAPIAASRVGDKPAAPASARARISSGDSSVATRRHEQFRANDLDKRLIPLLDGTRDRQALTDALIALAETNEITVQKDNQKLTDRAALGEALGGAMSQALDKYAASSLLTE